MAAQVDKNATRASTSISGPAYKVAVGGAPRGKPPRRYIISSTTQKTVIEEYRVVPRYLKPSNGSCHDSCKHASDEWKEYKHTRNLGPRRKYAMTTSRYLTPSTGSCHESCKHGKKDESMELRTTRTLASRKRSVSKNNGVKRTVVSVERKKITEIKPKPARASKIRANSQPVKVVKLQNSVQAKKVTKPITVTHSSPILKSKKVTKKRINKPSSPRKDQHVITKTELRLMIADKIQEMIMQEAETEEAIVEEPIESPETLTTEPTIVPNSEEVVDEDSSSENDESSSNEQALNSESVEEEEEVVEEEVVEEEVQYVLEEEENEDEDDGDDEEKGRRLRAARSEENEGEDGVKFRRGRVLVVEGEDGPKKLKFRARTELESDEDEEAEKVNLKQTEVGKKEAQELLNSVIEETASKLVEDMKTKVGALVGAFETVISLQDEVPAEK